MNGREREEDQRKDKCMRCEERGVGERREESEGEKGWTRKKRKTAVGEMMGSGFKFKGWKG